MKRLKLAAFQHHPAKTVAPNDGEMVCGPEHETITHPLLRRWTLRRALKSTTRQGRGLMSPGVFEDLLKRA